MNGLNTNCWIIDTFLAYFIVVFISSGFLDLSTETDADSGLSVQELIDMAKKELEKKKAAVVRKKSAANAPGQITNTFMLHLLN